MEKTGGQGEGFYILTFVTVIKLLNSLTTDHS